jgi:hypothetical protein
LTVQAIFSTAAQVPQVPQVPLVLLVQMERKVLKVLQVLPVRMALQDPQVLKVRQVPLGRMA